MQISKEDLFLPQNYLGEKAKQDQKTNKSLCARHVDASFSGGIRMVRQLLILIAFFRAVMAHQGRESI